MNLFDVLERAVKHYPAKDALRFQEASGNFYTLNYRQLFGYAERFSGGLARLGVKKGDRVAVFLPNMLEYPIVTYGALRIGAVPVLLSSALKSEGVGKYIERSRVKVLVTCEELWGEASFALSACNLEKIVVIGDSPSKQCLNLWEMLNHDIVPPKCELQPDDPAFILYTSGTTGEQKGAILSHGNVVSNIQAVRRYTGMRNYDRVMCFLPLFHCFGQNFVMNAIFNALGTLILHKRFMPNEILESLVLNSVTMFFSIPPNYRALLNLKDIRPFETVRYFFTAADTMPEEIALAWIGKYGRQIWEGWGLTETSPFATYNHETRYVPGSVGTPINGVEIGIVDEGGIKLGSGETGEIIVRGPNVFQGYFDDTETTREAIRNGWFFTGDIGIIDGAGYLRIVDRKNDRIKVSGFSVWPREMEKFINTHFGERIKDVGIIGVPDKEKGEMPFAYLVAGSPAPAEAEIINAVENKFPGYYRLGGVRFVEQIPKTPTGKILKKELRKSEAL
ncbi:MAG: AMP-binding protein [Candidatus Yanofskybacteria bacterium]|nr:AMP-binding protein [Candidatus Yanofskybacteria bacterium]